MEIPIKIRIPALIRCGRCRKFLNSRNGRIGPHLGVKCLIYFLSGTILGRTILIVSLAPAAPSSAAIFGLLCPRRMLHEKLGPDRKSVV